MLRLFLLLIFVQFAFCNITLTTERGVPVKAQAPVVVYWVRDLQDPTEFFVRKQKLDTDDGRPLTSEGFQVTVGDRTQRAGNLTIRFNRGGIFRLVAQVENEDEFVFESPQFPVIPPEVGAAETGTPTPSISIPPTGTNTAQATPVGTTKVIDNKPIIIGSVLGAVFLILASIVVFIIVRRRRQRRRKLSPSSEFWSSTGSQKQISYPRKSSLDGERPANVMPPPLVYAPKIPTTRERFSDPSMQPSYDIRRELRPPPRTPSMTTMHSNRSGMLRSPPPAGYNNARSPPPPGYPSYNNNMRYDTRPPIRSPSAMSVSTMHSSVSQLQPPPPPHGHAHGLRHSPSMATVTTAVSSQMQFTPMNARQMELDDEITELQSTLMRLEIVEGANPPTEGGVRMQRIRERIRKLTELKESTWAQGLTDEAPSGWR